MTNEVLFLCVIILVTSATTLVCQIFGNLCARKVLALEVPVSHRKGHLRRGRGRQRTRDHPDYSESSVDEDSLVSSDDTSNGQWCVIPSRSCKQPASSLPVVHRQKPRSRFNRKDNRARCRDGNCCKNAVYCNGNTSGTFRRLGIPQEDVMPMGLKHMINKLEDKNLSPFTDTMMTIQGCIWDQPHGHVARQLAFSPSGRSLRAMSVIPSVRSECGNFKAPTCQSHSYGMRVSDPNIYVAHHLKRTSSRHFVDDVALDVEGPAQPHVI